jgi:hypothetical protein
MTSAQMIASPLRFDFLIDRSFIMQGFRHVQVFPERWCKGPACYSVFGRKTPPGGPAGSRSADKTSDRRVKRL